MKNYRFRLLVLAFFANYFLFQPLVFSQTQDEQFEKEVAELVEKYNALGWKKGSVVFTGSSSIRLWKDLETGFPEYPIINTGFGGSQTHHLLTHLEPLVIRYEPATVFIYEGDNDINAGKSVQEIINTMDKVVRKISKENAEVQIHLISTKPSPSRWKLKDNYLALNKALSDYAEGRKKVTYIEVWKPMIGQDGRPIPAYYAADSLHLSDQGYKLWEEIISKYLP
ncbi:GDSL-type esterase/lipase family protein [Pararhodonellum marinum]|uniref:GDSL-type esterase/lipase family protein n=1 Tax=Pararhodonellum marinum TaxID=2755358 RepID=UPI00189085F1|nr:GDSL-type esterase/lipase family protein [Pararhodonellum marinum]